ncbi:hypothetical protein GT50_01295 [Geobacillus stearothermophilus 10]|nr:hypothetical protein GT50_01295 [Geobacillus stearothermophilus 10]
MALNFDKFLASWLPLIPKKMYDNISKSSPTMYMLMRKKKTWDEGGDIIRPHIKYKHTSTRGSYSKYDKLNINPDDTRTAAEFRMKQLYATIRFNGYEEAADKGDLAVHKLVAAALDDAEASLKDLFAQQIFGDGTGNSGKDLTGLKAYVDDGTAVAVYGGIDRATNPWWKANVKKSANNKVLDIKQMREVFAKCSRGGMENKPDFIVTDLNTWLQYAELVDGKTTIQQPLGKVAEEFANLGFAQLSFMGIPVVYDEYCPAYTMYFINSNTFQLYGKPGRMFTTSEIVKIPDEDSKVGQIFFAGEFVGTEPRANGRLDLTVS